MGGRRTRTRHPTTTPDPEDDPPPFRPVAQERIYVAVVTGDQQLTLTEVDQTANRIAHVLAEIGTRVLVFSPHLAPHTSDLAEQLDGLQPGR